MMKSTVVTNAMIENMFGMVIKACFAAAAEYVSEQPQEAPKKIKATRAPRIVSREEGKKDSFLIPGESKVIPRENPTVEIKNNRGDMWKKNKYIVHMKEEKDRRKILLKDMSRKFNGDLSDSECAKALGVSTATIVAYSKEIEKENACKVEA